MSFSMVDLNLILSTLLSVTAVSIVLLALKIRALKNERDSALEQNKADSKILFLKSRYASMGETVGNIAHQWKQPLNAIGSIQNSIKASLIFQGEISKEKLLDSVDKSFSLLQHLGETIDTFYSFLSQRNNEEMSFAIADELESIRKITEYSFQNSRITLNFILDANPMIQGNPNEFTHALLNLILNAKDAFDGSDSDSPTITVHVADGSEICTITISDNAGGIRVEPIDMVFDLHISTKEEGSGLGLFMTKNIIEKRFGGTIGVENKNGGACFTITLPYAEYGEHYSPETATDEKLSLARINQLTHKIIELEELEKTLRKWADIFKQAHWGIAMHVGKSNTFEMTNTAFHTLYGYTAEELKNLSVPDLFSPESLPLLSKVQQEAFEKGYVAFESVHKRRDGSTFPVSVELIVVKNDEGEILYHIANIWDLTEKKAAEERLLLKKFALNHIQDAVFMIDEHARFHYVNEGACKALGYTREELMEMDVGDVDPDWPSERWQEHWEVLKKAGSMTMELRHRRKDGTIFPVEVSANYIEYHGKHYNMAIARDITERLQLAAQKENERMKLFFERQLVGMAITSPQKGWLHTNEKLQQMLGYTHEELTQLTWAEMTYPEDLAPDVEQFEKLLHGEIEDYMLEKRFIRKDGSLVYTNLAVSCVRNDDGTVNYVLALLEDITERKELEALLEKERKFLIDAQRVAHTGSWYLNIQQGSLTWSDETYRIFELNKEDVDDLHKTFYERVHPEDRESVEAPYVESLKTKLPYEVEHRIVMEDGRIKYVIERCEHRYAPNGTPLYSIGTVQDITERKQMEIQLEDAHNFLNKVIDSIPDPIFVKDREHRWVMLNEAFCTLIDRPRFMLLGQSDYDFFPKEEADVFWEKDELVFRSRDINVNEEPFTSSDGTTHYIQTVKSVFVSTDGEEHLVGVIRDITERREMEDELKKALEFNEGVIGAIPDLLFEIAPDGTYVGVWAQDEAMLAAQKEIMLGKNFKEILPPDAIITALQAIKEVDEKGFSLGKTYSLDLPEGKRWFELSISKKKMSGNYIVLSRDVTERKDAEEALQSNRNLLHTILESSPGIITFALDTRYRYIAFDSKHAEVMKSIFGKEIALGINMLELITSDTDREIAKRSFDRALGGENFIAEEEYTDERLSHHYWQIFYAPIRSESGEIIGLACFNMDITERRQKEEMIRELNTTLEEKVKERTVQLQQSLEFSEGIINALPDLLFELDRNGLYLNIWARDEELLAAQKELLLGHTLYEALSKEAADTVMEAVREAESNGTSFGKIIKIDLPQGARYFEQSVSQKSSTNTFVILSRDITERLEVDKALHQSEEMFRAIVENSPDVISRYDLQMKRTYVNPMMEFLMGKPSEELVGKTPKEFSPLPDIESFERLFKAVVYGGSELEYEGPYQTPWGEIRWGNQRLIPEFDVDHNVVSVMVIGRDMTERKNTEKQLKLLETAINNADEAVYIIDENRLIVYVNNAACKMSGYTEDELIGMSILTIDEHLSEKDLCTIFENVPIESQFTFETKHRTKEGDILNVEVNSTCFIYEGIGFGVSLVKEIS